MPPTAFVVREAAIRPRSGQRVILRHHAHTFGGTVRAFLGDRMWLDTDPGCLLGALRLGTRLDAEILTGDGTLMAQFLLTSAAERIPGGGTDRVAVLQLLGLPSLAQRRGAPRIAVQVPAQVTWVSRAGAAEQAGGRTQNLSLTGALLRFPQEPVPMPPGHGPVLVELTLPSGRVPVPVRMLQVWESGARARFLDLDPHDRDTLRAFIEPRLR